MGIILMMALAVTVYANAVRSDIPVYGMDAESAWDAEIAGALRQLSRSTGQGLAEGAPVTVLLPPPPPARAVEMPFIGGAVPFSPSGTVFFDPRCGSFGATHVAGDGSAVTDLVSGSTGCLAFDAQPVYSKAFGYRMEYGGLVRVQGDRAIVVSGPPLEVEAVSPGEYRASLGLPGLRGHAISASNDAGSVRVDLVPGPAAREIEDAANARNATWTLVTEHPAAWKSWFESRFAQAGFTASRTAPLPGQSAADYTLRCMPVDCSVGASGKGTLVVTLEGPRTDVADLRLSFSYGVYDVNVQ
ncbi:MAG TPA: hypothetical protein VM889_10320 [Candidatus Thermoplasmatota archaeon]|nr:hypothetical protein [Candidatus Thermoplasmatota archaeon]